MNWLGSTFKVYLPRVDEVVPQRSHPEVISTKRTGAKTVLLVEDEESLRSLILTFLEQDGYTVLEAGDGKKAIEIAEQHGGPIHLLLTDVVMPEMNGPALAGRFAQAYPESKVVYMSGYSDFSRRGLLDAEAILLPKPFTRDALLSKLHEVLDSRKELTTS